MSIFCQAASSLLSVISFSFLMSTHAHTDTHIHKHTPEVPCGSCLERTFFPSEVPLWNYWTRREIGQFNPLYFTPSLVHSSSLVSLLTCLSQWCLPPSSLPAQLSVRPDSKAIIFFSFLTCIHSFHPIFFLFLSMLHPLLSLFLCPNWLSTRPLSFAVLLWKLQSPQQETGDFACPLILIESKPQFQSDHCSHPYLHYMLPQLSPSVGC